MSSYQQAKFLIDYKAEQIKENQALSDVYSVMDDDARKRDRYGLGGKVIGGLLGFVSGGVKGAYQGYKVGGSLGTLFAPQEFDTDMLKDDVFSGGKFNAGEMLGIVDDIEYTDAAEDIAMYTNTVSSLFDAYMKGGELKSDKPFDFENLFSFLDKEDKTFRNYGYMPSEPPL